MSDVINFSTWQMLNGESHREDQSAELCECGSSTFVIVEDDRQKEVYCEMCDRFKGFLLS